MYKGIVFSFLLFFNIAIASQKDSVSHRKIEIISQRTVNDDRLKLVTDMITYFLQSCGTTNTAAQQLLKDLESNLLSNELQKLVCFKSAEKVLMRESAARFETKDRSKIVDQEKLIKTLKASIKQMQGKIDRAVLKGDSDILSNSTTTVRDVYLNKLASLGKKREKKRRLIRKMKVIKGANQELGLQLLQCRKSLAEQKRLYQMECEKSKRACQQLQEMTSKFKLVTDAAVKVVNSIDLNKQ